MKGVARESLKNYPKELVIGHRLLSDSAGGGAWCTGCSSV